MFVQKGAVIWHHLLAEFMFIQLRTEKIRGKETLWDLRDRLPQRFCTNPLTAICLHSNSDGNHKALTDRMRDDTAHTISLLGYWVKLCPWAREATHLWNASSRSDAFKWIEAFPCVNKLFTYGLFSDMPRASISQQNAQYQSEAMWWSPTRQTSELNFSWLRFGRGPCMCLVVSCSEIWSRDDFTQETASAAGCQADTILGSQDFVSRFFFSPYQQQRSSQLDQVPTSAPGSNSLIKGHYKVPSSNSSCACSPLRDQFSTAVCDQHRRQKTVHDNSNHLMKEPRTSKRHLFCMWRLQHKNNSPGQDVDMRAGSASKVLSVSQCANTCSMLCHRMSAPWPGDVVDGGRFGFTHASRPKVSTSRCVIQLEPLFSVWPHKKPQSGHVRQDLWPHCGRSWSSYFHT